MWVAVQTKPQAELRTGRGLEAAGFPAWYPVERVRVIHRWDRSIVIRPLFQRYVFAELGEPMRDLGDVHEVDGVTGVLRAAGRPLGIPGNVVEALRRAEAEHVFDRTRAAPLGIVAGETVRVVGGPFDGLLAKVRSAKSRKRIEVLVDFVHRVTVSVDRIAKIAP